MKANATASTPNDASTRCLICFSPLLRWLPSKVSIDQFFRELHTLEFSELRTPIQTAIQRQADLPGPCKYHGVLDRGFIIDHIGIPVGISLRDMQLVTMKISGAIKPGLIVEPRDVDDQRVAFPSAVRGAHPRIHRSLTLPLRIDHAIRCCKLVCNRNVLLALND